MSARTGLGIAIALLALAVVGWVYAVTPKHFLYPDAHYYAEMGRQVARGEGFTSLQAYPLLLSWLDGLGHDLRPPWPNVSRFPLITILYAGPFALFGASAAVVLALGGIFLVLTTVVTYLLGTRLFAAPPGALAAVLVTTNVSQLVFAMSGLLETPAAFFLAATGLALVATLDADAVPRARRRAVVLGWLLGLSFLLRYDLLALAPAAAAALWLGRGGRGLRALPLVVLGFALVVGPWVARNLVSFGSPIAFLGIDRNVLWSSETGDPYAERSYTPWWEQLAENPEVLEQKLDNLSWPIDYWYLLFGWRLEWLGPAFLVAGVVLAVLRHRALATYAFVAIAFLGRWLIFTVTHHEARFYASFVPLFLVLTIGAAWALLERVTRRRGVVRRAAFGALAVLLLAITLPRSFGSEPMGRGREKGPTREQLALLRARTPPKAVVATPFAFRVAWYGDRPAVEISPLEIAEVERRGLRVDGLLYGTWARRYVERTLASQGLAQEFVEVDVGAGATLWLRRRLAEKPVRDAS